MTVASTLWAAMVLMVVASLGGRYLGPLVGLQRAVVGVGAAGVRVDTGRGRHVSQPAED